MALSPEAASFTKYWGSITASVSARANTATLFAAVRQAAADLGETLPVGAFKGITELRSRAVSVRNASQTFARADEITPVSVLTAPQAIWARSLEAQSVAPKIQATYELTHQLPGGEPVSEYRTLYDIEWTPDLTAGDVRSLISDAAEEQAQRTATGETNYPTGAVVAIDNISLVAY